MVKREAGKVSLVPATFPTVIKPKHYRQEWRTRFAEALLARRVLLAEGHTEYHALPAAARRLHHLNGTAFKTLEALGIAVVNAGSDSQIAPLGEHFRRLGKKVFAIFDQQEAVQRTDIIAKVDHPFESPEHGFETLVVNHTAEAALRRFGLGLVARSEWPPHLTTQMPIEAMSLADLKNAMRRYLEWSKGAEGAAELLEVCAEAEMPEFIRTTILRIREIVEPPPPLPPAAAAVGPAAPAPPPAAANPLPAGDNPVQTQS